MSIMNFLDRQIMRDGAFKQLAIGCEKHPSYRGKAAPRSKCRRCLYLFDLAQEMELWEQEWKNWTAARLAADRAAMREESRRLEAYANSHQ